MFSFVLLVYVLFPVVLGRSSRSFRRSKGCHPFPSSSKAGDCRPLPSSREGEGGHPPPSSREAEGGHPLPSSGEATCGHAFSRQERHWLVIFSLMFLFACLCPLLGSKDAGGSYPLLSSSEAEVDILFLLLERQGVASHPFERSKGHPPLPSSREAEGSHPLLAFRVAEGGRPLHSSSGQNGWLSSAGF